MEIFLFYFEMAIQITGSAQNNRVGRVSGNTPIFLGLRQAILSARVNKLLCLTSCKGNNIRNELTGSRAAL